MLVRMLAHGLLGDLLPAVLQGRVQLLEARLDFEDGTFSLLFLNGDLRDVLLKLFQLFLLLLDLLLRFVVLVLDNAQLHRDFSNFILLVLVGSRVVAGFEQRVRFDEALRAVAYAVVTVMLGCGRAESQALLLTSRLTRISFP